jgi:hypothetical protein
VANERDAPLAGNGSAASTNYINALNVFSAAKTASRNAQNVLNLAIGQVAANCDASTLPIAETYSKLTGPDYSFAIVVDAQPLLGIVEGVVVDIVSPSADYRATRAVRGSTKVGAVVVGDNSFGPLRQIDLWQEVAVEGGGTSLRVVASFYSETVPISFAFSEPSGTDQIGIVNGNIVSLVTSGAGYRAGSQRRSSLKGLFAIGLIDKDGTLCGSSEAAASAAEAALATANSQLSAAQASLATATAALPNTSELFQQDVCGKRLNSCKLRFGATELPFGAFPGANLSR